MTTNFDNLVGKKSPDSSLLESDFFGVKGMELYKQLESKIPDADFAEFVIHIANKTVKQEDSLVRQIVYTALSAKSNDPINLGIIAPTSEGKTYPVVETLGIFPQKDIWYIGGMSPMVLVRQKGIIVDKNNQPIGNEVKRIKKEMFLLGNGKADKQKMFELKEELSNLLEDSKRLIDLTNKVIVFLDAPHPELWDRIKPILSHDKFEVDFPYVDKSNDKAGMSVQNIVVRGYPACIFCSAKDESKWPQWPEIASRFLITSPNMIQQKYLESNILIAQRKGLPGLLQQQIIRSDEDNILARLCVDFLNEQIQTICQKKHPPVWIPYYKYLAKTLPSNKGTDSRTTKRIFSVLNIIPLTKAHIRDKLVYDVETLVIANIEDLEETLRITNDITGIPTFKMKFFKEVFYPLEKSKKEPDKNDLKQETIIAVTTRQLCDYYRKTYHKTISSDNLKKTFLTELLNCGIIDQEPSVIDQRQHIFRSLINIEDGNELDEKYYRNYTNIRLLDNISSQYNIRTPNNFEGIPKKWLLLEILNLLNYRIGIDKIELISHKTGERMSMSSMCEEYEKNTMLNRYFSIPKFSTFRSEVFGTMKYLGEIHQKTNEELSNQDKFVYVRQSEIEDSGLSGKSSADIQATQVTLDAEQQQLQHIKNDYEAYVATTKKKIDKIIDSNNKKHDIYWSGSQWYCNNCKEHGDKPYMTQETTCKGDAGELNTITT